MLSPFLSALRMFLCIRRKVLSLPNLDAATDHASLVPVPTMPTLQKPAGAANRKRVLWTAMPVSPLDVDRQN